jgi:hypothetical protein
MKQDALDKLHGFYQPPPPSWMPQTIGWYVVFGIVILLLVWMGWRAWAHWRHNRYRREALRELAQADSSAIPALLKRTALAVWPREKVASLSGDAWLQFLEAHGRKNSFSSGPGHVLLDLDYRGAGLTSQEERALRELASEWIRRHHVRA